VQAPFAGYAVCLFRLWVECGSDHSFRTPRFPRQRAKSGYDVRICALVAPYLGSDATLSLVNSATDATLKIRALDEAGAQLAAFDVTLKNGQQYLSALADAFQGLTLPRAPS